MVRDFIYNWYIKWYEKHYGYKHKENHFACDYQMYSRKEYDGEEYEEPLKNEVYIIMNLLHYCKDRYPFTNKLCKLLKNFVFQCFLFISKIWRKKNHLVDSSDKYTYKILSPAIKAGLDDMYKQDLIYYTCLLEKYGKKELDSWGFEKRPHKKVGKLKRIWYDLTLTVY